MAHEHKIAGIQAECDPHLLDLTHKSLDVPECRILGVVAISRTELVVVIVFDAGTGKIAVGRFKVFVCRTGTPVQEKDFEGRIIPDALGPNMEGAERGFYGNTPRTTRPGIVSAGLVEVGRHFRVFRSRCGHVARREQAGGDQRKEKITHGHRDEIMWEERA
jgi:hypothetical protein